MTTSPTAMAKCMHSTVVAFCFSLVILDNYSNAFLLPAVSPTALMTTNIKTTNVVSSTVNSGLNSLSPLSSRFQQSQSTSFTRDTNGDSTLSTIIKSLTSSSLSSSSTTTTTSSSSVDFEDTPNKKTKNSSKVLSQAAKWHQHRRKEMISKYASQIRPLEDASSSTNNNDYYQGLFTTLPLLFVANFCLMIMSIKSCQLSIFQIIAISVFPGSIFSLWQLQLCHDALHGSIIPKKGAFNDDNNDNDSNKSNNNDVKKKIKKWIIRHRNKIHSNILYWGSMPNAFGYYLYLQYGHLNHHKYLGNEQKSNLETLFTSSDKNFEDGDALFVAHRMKLKGNVGPVFQIKLPYIMKQAKQVTMSISNGAFSLWKDDHPLYNAVIFTCSFLLERMLLMINDVFVALLGKNFFFLNKPKEFHQEVATYCRIMTLLRAGLCYMGGKSSSPSMIWSWKPLLFLYLAETLWSIPPHPACAMFITNHGSGKHEEEGHGVEGGEGMCIPSSSTYAGRLYSIFTLGTNYHVEHHDFPTIPFYNLSRLKEIAPEYYYNQLKDDDGNIMKNGKQNVFAIMKKTFSKPEFYACMDAGI
jgi:fatty acid desaturase